MRKEIVIEINFLKTWAFNFDMLKKSEWDEIAKQVYESAHQTVADCMFCLEGKAMAWHTDKSLIMDLNRLKVTFKDLAKKGYFNSPAELKKQSDMVDSIIKMLSMTVGNNSIGLF